MNGEPEWAAAQREEGRRSNNIWKGMFAGNGLSAVLLALMLSVEREVYLFLGGYVFAFVSVASLYIAKRSESGSLMRSAAVTMGLLFLFAAIMFWFVGVRT